MRSACQIAIICAGLATVSGCQGNKPADRAEATARVDAALQIGNPTQRDDALASACRDAARLGAGEAVVKGIGKIGNPTVRDEVAVDCALELRDSGQAAAANEVAKLVGNPTKRDEVLKKLAAGS